MMTSYRKQALSLIAIAALAAGAFGAASIAVASDSHGDRGHTAGSGHEAVILSSNDGDFDGDNDATEREHRRGSKAGRSYEEHGSNMKKRSYSDDHREHKFREGKSE